jgi:hypothetical protein
MAGRQAGWMLLTGTREHRTGALASRWLGPDAQTGQILNFVTGAGAAAANPPPSSIAASTALHSTREKNQWPLSRHKGHTAKRSTPKIPAATTPHLRFLSPPQASYYTPGRWLIIRPAADAWPLNSCWQRRIANTRGWFCVGVLMTRYMGLTNVYSALLKIDEKTVARWKWFCMSVFSWYGHNFFHFYICSHYQWTAGKRLKWRTDKIYCTTSHPSIFKNFIFLLILNVLLLLKYPHMKISFSEPPH